MAQAKTLTPAELDQVLDFISQRSFALRNRVMLLTGMWSGMRVSEIASLSVGDVMNANGTVKAEVDMMASEIARRMQDMPTASYVIRKQVIGALGMAYAKRELEFTAPPVLIG